MKAIVFLSPDRNENGSWSMNYDDNNMLAELLKLGCAVSLIAIGDAAAKPVLREGLAMGAERGLLLTEAGEWDSMKQAWYVSQAVRRWGSFDLLCAGGHTGQELVGIMAAELLGIPQVTQVVELCLESGGLCMKRSAGECSEWIRAQLPCFAANGWMKGTPGTLTFSDIQDSLEKELHIKAAVEEYGEARDFVRLLTSGTLKQHRLGKIAQFGKNDEAVRDAIHKTLSGVIYGG